MKIIAGFLLKLMGWKINPYLPTEEKYVLAIAPHTSFWDFIIGRLAFYKLGVPAKFFIKKEFFTFPIARLLVKMGGIPIDRSQAKNVVYYASTLLKKEKKLVLTITPEGTRKYTEKWKKGFYYIALHAQTPLYLAYLDYKKKEGGFLPPAFPISGDYEKDIIEIQKKYKGIQAKFPENFYDFSSEDKN